MSLSGVFGFVALFIPVWWSWIGTTFYANRFDSDDVGHRLLTAVQMLAIAALAINVHHGLGESCTGFALAYALGRAVLVVEYIRAGWHIHTARPLTTRFISEPSDYSLSRSRNIAKSAVPSACVRDTRILQDKTI